MKQRGTTVIEKHVEECDYDGKTLYSKLTQDETLKLTAGVDAAISIVVKTQGGDRFENRHPFVVSVRDTAKDGVI